jgi:hypothetical protein
MVNRTVVLTRNRALMGPGGTPGDLLVPDVGWRCKTVERPPEGEHPCVPFKASIGYGCLFLPHPREGDRYELQAVPGRTAILIHPANVWQQLLGCITLGEAHAWFEPGVLPHGLPDVRTLGVAGSVATVHAFEALMQLKPFTLIIQ